MAAFMEIVQELVAFSLIVSLMGNLCSHTDFYKYFRFFSGIILILILIKPISSLLNVDIDFRKILQDNLQEYDRSILEEELKIADDKSRELILEEYEKAEKAAANNTDTTKEEQNTEDVEDSDLEEEEIEPVKDINIQVTAGMKD